MRAKPERFVPWPLLAEKHEHSIDPATGIRPIGEWGGACGMGFVSNARFGPGDTVIARTRRKHVDGKEQVSVHWAGTPEPLANDVNAGAAGGRDFRTA